MDSHKPIFVHLSRTKIKEYTAMDKLLLPFLSVLLVLTSCNSGYEIAGTSSFKNMDGGKFYAKIFVDGEWVTLDSAEVIHGTFKMKGKADSVALVTLFAGEEAVMPVVLEKGKIDVTISDIDLYAKGTPLNDALYEYIGKRNKFDEQLSELDRKESMMVMEGGDIDEIHNQIINEQQKMSDEMDEYIKKFITDNYDNVLGPSIFMTLCNALPYPIMTPQLESIIDNAPYSFKMNSRIKSFIAAAKENMQLIEENRRLQVNIGNR